MRLERGSWSGRERGRGNDLLVLGPEDLGHRRERLLKIPKVRDEYKRRMHEVKNLTQSKSPPSGAQSHRIDPRCTR